jgi:CRISPR-associated protein Cmr3
MIQTLFLQAVDVWLFRDGRPFDAGSAHRAESVFPPYPTVVQGAFRTHKLLLAGINLGDTSTVNKQKIVDLVGDAGLFGNLRLRGPFLARRESDEIVRYFPQPADSIIDGKTLVPARLQPPTSTLRTSAVLPQLFGLNQKSGKQKESLWLSETALMKFMENETVKGIPSSELFEREERVGIGMNQQRVTVDGMLYEAEFIRPVEGVGLLVELGGYDEPEWGKSGILYLGGEGRMATFDSVDVDLTHQSPVSASRFKVYFSTPAYFENGWLPKTWSNFFASPVHLVGAALQRYETLGGFNWAVQDTEASAHRPARRFIPAGSVYYFEGSPELNPGLIQQAITDFGAEIGFGQTIIKEW